MILDSSKSMIQYFIFIVQPRSVSLSAILELVKTTGVFLIQDF